jgi:hypothetical protein
MAMTVDQMKEAKRQAENAVTAALQGFMDATGLRVEDVRVSFMDYSGMGDPTTKRVVVGVELMARL